MMVVAILPSFEILGGSSTIMIARAQLSPLSGTECSICSYSKNAYAYISHELQIMGDMLV